MSQDRQSGGGRCRSLLQALRCPVTAAHGPSAAVHDRGKATIRIKRLWLKKTVGELSYRLIFIVLGHRLLVLGHPHPVNPHFRLVILYLIEGSGSYSVIGLVYAVDLCGICPAQGEV